MDANTLYADAKKLYDAGQMDDALRAFEQAHAAYVAQGNAAEAATVANDLGVVYYLAGRRDDAHKILQDALSVFEKLGNVPRGTISARQSCFIRSAKKDSRRTPIAR
jgi:tetratricopeptide (TPR) repeat protein